MTVADVADSTIAHARSDDPNDDYCKKGEIILCPPGATHNEECRCIPE